MNCVKCGREAPENRLFCDECVEEMEKYPVKPDAVVLLPPVNSTAAKKKPVRKKAVLTPEEQVKKLKSRVRVLAALVLILSLMMGAMTYVTITTMDDILDRTSWGQNYSSRPQPGN